MALLKLNEGPFDRFGSRFENIIDPTHFLGRSAFDIPYSNSFPPTNFSKTKEAYCIELMVPGFKKNELVVTVEKGMLIIKGTKTEKIPDRNSNTLEDREYIIEEFGMERFERRFRLRNEHSFDRMEARLEDGILRIVFFEMKDPVTTQYKRVQVTE